MTKTLFFGFFAAAALAFIPNTFAMEGVTTSRGAPEYEAQTLSAKTFPEFQEIEQNGLRPHVGVTLGVASPEGSYATGAEWGVNFGFQPYIPFGTGIAITSSRNSARDNKRELERTTALLRGTYNFGGTIPVIKNSYVGLTAGPSFNQDAMYFGLGPIVGFDIPVREWSGRYLSFFSVGVDARYLVVSADESDALSVNGALKYWF